MEGRETLAMKTLLTGITMIATALLGGELATDPDDPAAEPTANSISDLSSYESGVVGGPHDFSDPLRGMQDACRACHVPHVQEFRPTTQPADGQVAYEMFRIGGQRRVFEPDRYTPGPTSLICLGCHDGTVATSTIGGAHSMLAGVREGFAMPDGFVWRDHPIGIPYSRERREYRPESFVLKEGIRLPEGRVECISCHDPHNAHGHAKMLSVSNKRSALCLTCHIK
jgi:predicted CXXCH cytochrome family protein